jgi:S-adenosylmethionine:tRNA ribosyltransferase-isomerase
LIKDARKIRPGTRIQFGEGFSGDILEVKGGKAKIRFTPGGEVMDLVQKFGHIPLPPYIRRPDEPQDRERYQTILAEKDGSIAAPTAGLHFTHSLLQSIQARGVHLTRITLHVGIGTFAPVRVQEIKDHTMETEWVEIPEKVALAIEETKGTGGRVIAVGTTTTRALESVADSQGRVKPGQYLARLFIYPGYCFRIIDALITNFHLPKSTLIMLVSALVGKDFLMKAYQEAIAKKYRFYSYGDAMLIL